MPTGALLALCSRSEHGSSRQGWKSLGVCMAGNRGTHSENHTSGCVQGSAVYINFVINPRDTVCATFWAVSYIQNYALSHVTH